MKRIVCFLLTIGILSAAASCAPENSPFSQPNTDTATIALESDSQVEIDSETSTLETDSEVEIDTVAVAEPKQSALTLFVGESFSLDYEIYGEGGIEWFSSNASVSVRDGVVYACAEGTALVGGGGEQLCQVRVLPSKPSALYIQVNGASITSKEEYVPCTVKVDSENDQHDRTDLSAGIRLRGNSTSRRPKKPYRIKFDSKQNLLGMNNGAECKSWVLLAEYQDDSMIRTSSCLSLADMILSEYSSDWRYVSLYIDGEYQGVYSLCEQSQIQEHRIDIEEAGEESTSLASGYLFELDASPPHDDKIRVSYLDYAVTDLEGDTYKHATNDDKVYGLMYYSLKNNNCSEDQSAFAARYIQNVMNILYYATYKGELYTLNERAELIPSSYTTAEEAISAVIDIDSFVRMYLLSELICNGDEYKKSFYMYVDFSENGTGLLTFACPWDFDGAIVAWNTYNYRDPYEYLAAKKNLWYVMAMKNEWFRERVAEVWKELYKKNDGFSSIPTRIRKITEAYRSEFSLDARLWSRQNSQSEQAEKTATWFFNRIVWLSLQFSNL